MFVFELLFETNEQSGVDVEQQAKKRLKPLITRCQDATWACQQTTASDRAPGCAPLSQEDEERQSSESLEKEAPQQIPNLQLPQSALSNVANDEPWTKDSVPSKRAARAGSLNDLMAPFPDQMAPSLALAR